ncbi:MAG: hypothetical protein AAGA11_02020 [Pseudomonadota bacterium]
MNAPSRHAPSHLSARSSTRPVRALRRIGHTLALSLLSLTGAQALDTDIYFDRSVGVQPNVVFYLDSSGSMGASMAAPAQYDNTNTYTGPFDPNTLYYSLDGTIPTSTASVHSGALSFLHCETGRSHIFNRNWGFYTARFVARLPNPVPGNTTAEDVWLPLANGTWNTASPHLLECFEDQNFTTGWGHGENGTTFNAFASPSKTSPWTTNQSAQIDWDPVGWATVMRGNYINYKLAPPSGPNLTRIEVMRQIIKELGQRFPMMNAGIASMNGNEGASINFEVSDISDAGWRHVYENTINEINAGGATPLAEGLYEIYRYFRGDPVHFGLPPFGQSVPRAYSTSNVYHTPVTHECQRNHVIMLTDGVPWSDSNQALIQTLPNFDAETGVTGSCFSGNNRDSSNSCLDDLARYMANVDVAPGLANVLDDDNDGVPDGQVVKVHPVGIQIDFELLERTAEAAGTRYYTAQNAIQLERDLMELLSNLTRNQSVASSLVTSSDQFSRLSHRSEVFIAQYEPTSRFQWKGNLKKYRIHYDGLRPYLTDSDEVNNPEILTADGSILASARSYWSSSNDGNDILKGGARERLAAKAPNTRHLYSRTTDLEANLSSWMHALEFTNPPVNAGLGAFERSNAERERILDYAKGVDLLDADGDGSTSDGRGQIGAMVRNQPIVIQYGGTEANPDLVVFTATSDGYLHGFDGVTGDEIFAIAPSESLPHFVTQYDNQNTGKNRWWGIDGNLSAHIIDRNRDGTISRAAGDSAVLYLSYGLGGRVVYSFDVTEANNRTSPQIIEIAKKHSGLNSRWSELGHALSKPVPFRMRNTSTAQNFMAFSMGYDPNAEFSYTGHTMGRGIAILRTDDGSIAWSGYASGSPAFSDDSFTNMDFAFVAEPSTLDTNNDGFADRLYAVDLGAQVWRFDIEDHFVRRSSSSVDGWRGAALGRDADGERRRAYKQVQAVMVQDKGAVWAALVVGSGDRMNPTLSPNTNRLFMIKDTNTLGVPQTTPFDAGDLYNATANTIGSLTNQTLLAQEYEDLRAANGWYIDLPPDRKAISRPVIAEGIINYPVYTIPSSSNPCQHNIGQGSLYRMALYDAQPVHDYNLNGTLDTDDREIPLKGAGIPPDAVGHRDPEGNLSVCVGFECYPADPNVQPGDENPKVYESYWFQR